MRSSVDDILRVTVEKMASLGAEPRDIHAAIGASIGRCCFETDGDVPEAVEKLLGRRDGFVTEKDGGKYTVDLRAVVGETLLRAGLTAENIAVSDECTVCLNKKYWSLRYTAGIRGSQASIIML